MRKVEFLWILPPLLTVCGCKGETVVAFEIADGTAMESESELFEGSDSTPSACISKTASPGDSVRTVQVGDVSRSYLLHVPTAYTGALPSALIVDYHSMGDSAAIERSDSPFPPVTDPDGVIVAFPDGLSGSSGTAWNIGTCCVDGAEDIPFTRAMIADIESVACIDAARIYAVGLSMGGAMAYYVACQAADLFAAVSPSSSDMIDENVEGCTPARPISVIAFRGTDEPFLPYEGGTSTLTPENSMTFLGAQNSFALWADLDGCTGFPSDVGNGCQAYSASQCDGGAEVMLCTEQGGGIAFGDPAFAWPILKRHSLPEI